MFGVTDKQSDNYYDSANDETVGIYDDSDLTNTPKLHHMIHLLATIDLLYLKNLLMV